MREWKFFRYLNILIRKAVIFLCVCCIFTVRITKTQIALRVSLCNLEIEESRNWKFWYWSGISEEWLRRTPEKRKEKIKWEYTASFHKCRNTQTEKEKERTCKTSKITQQNILTVSKFKCLCFPVPVDHSEGGRAGWRQGWWWRSQGSQTFKGMRRHRWRKRRKRGQDSPETPRFGP